MRKALKKFKKQYDIYLFQNRWAEILVGVVIIGFFVWGMWAIFNHVTTKEWNFMENSSGEVTGLRTTGSRGTIVYTLVKLDEGSNVAVIIPIEYDIRIGRFIVLDKYVNKKNAYEFQYRFNLENQAN